MATPLRFKYKWPSQKQDIGAGVSDFIPYLSNVANMFTRTPNPQAPTLVNPITNSKISLANAKAEVENASRAADLSTQGLDAQTGAAVRVGNLATKLRSLSDLNSREAMANAQIGNQTNMINANIEAQNAGMINQYHDDMTNAQLTRNRIKSENLSNAVDKYIMQKGVKDQIQLEKDKANILSKQYNPGVYTRLLDKLQQTGTDTAGFGTVPKISPFDKVRNTTFPAYKGPGGAPITSPSVEVPTSMDQIPANVMGSLRKYLKQRNTYAAGGMLNVFGNDTGDPIAKAPGTKQEGLNSNDMIFSDPITRNARLADVMNQVVSGGYHPYNSIEGRNALSQVKSYFDPQFTTDFTARTLQLQGEPGYATMTPEQRLQRYYALGRGGTSALDKFITQTSSYGGSPSAFYQNSPMKAYGGKMIKPFC